MRSSISRKLKKMSWKTSVGGLFGLLAFIFAVLAIIKSGQTGQPIDLAELLGILTGLSTLIIGLFGRDNDKSSQDAGIRTGK